ncbi:MAG TPA: phosphoribosylformylglycinamidine synthase subunit PurS [Dehalococcoidia bacterium]|nr:phosphoribosylformylglycinamidine synthase subunit PurS [Dehalococcoidia bacterium]
MRYQARIRVTLKKVVNDPQGLTVRGALHSLGFAAVQNVRVGKYLELALDAADEAAAREQVGEMCRKLLANPVIEEFSYEVNAAS